MDEQLLPLSIEERWKLVTHVRRSMARRSKEARSSFGIISFGSCVYGFRKKSGKGITDIDNFLVVPSGVSYDAFASLACAIIPNVGLVSQKHFTRLQLGEFNIIRMYGHDRGVKISFRVMLLDTFLEITSVRGMTKEVANVAGLNAQRTICDIEPIIGEPGSYKIQLKIETIQDEPEMLAVYHYVLSRDGTRLGVLGQKLLMSRVTYDPFRGKLHKRVLNLWQVYVRLSFWRNRDMSPKQIIDKLIRSEKFSPSFRKMLSKRIVTYQRRLKQTKP